MCLLDKVVNKGLILGLSFFFLLNVMQVRFAILLAPNERVVSGLVISIEIGLFVLGGRNTLWHITALMHWFVGSSCCQVLEQQW